MREEFSEKDRLGDEEGSAGFVYDTSLPKLMRVEGLPKVSLRRECNSTGSVEENLLFYL